MKTKRCPSCHAEKSLLLFHHDRSMLDGRSRLCKVCATSRTKRWKRENMGHYVGKMPGIDLHSIRTIANKPLT